MSHHKHIFLIATALESWAHEFKIVPMLESPPDGTSRVCFYSETKVTLINIIYVCTLVGCPGGFQYLPEARGCYRIVEEALNWAQSQAICPFLDPRAHLAVITNKEQDEAVIAYLASLNQPGSSIQILMNTFSFGAWESYR